MTAPLDGIRVVELGQMIAVPYATYLLAAQGAAVVKVESVGGGDELRHYGSRKGGLSAWYVNCNGGKRSLAVDLQRDEGKEILWRLLADADVFVQGLRPGVVAKLGFGYDSVAAHNPRLIYCSSSGFGPQGPDSALPVYDPIIQARSGWAGAQRNDAGPTLVRGMVADKVAALTTAQLVTAALVQRGRTGAGTHVETSMLEANVAFNWPDVMMHCSLQDPDAEHRPNLLASYRLFRCADGWVCVAAGTDRQWRAFCEAVGRHDLAGDPRLATAAARGGNIDYWYACMDEMVQPLPRDALIKRLSRADVPAAAVRDPAEVAADPQVQALGILRDVEHPVAGRLRQPRPGAAAFGHDLKLSPAPRLGEHSAAILAELGYDHEAASRLTRTGVVGSATAPAR